MLSTDEYHSMAFMHDYSMTDKGCGQVEVGGGVATTTDLADP